MTILRLAAFIGFLFFAAIACSSGSDSSGAALPTSPYSIASVSPDFGAAAGGIAITITGAGWESNDTATVTVGGVSATGVSVTSATTIAATVPAGTAGLADVTITISGSSATKSGGFRYLADESFGGGPITSSMGLRFFDKYTKNAIAGATVMLGTDGTNFQTTDVNGSVTFTGISGPQTVTFIHSAYQLSTTFGFNAAYGNLEAKPMTPVSPHVVTGTASGFSPAGSAGQDLGEFKVTNEMEKYPTGFTPSKQEKIVAVNAGDTSGTFALYVDPGEEYSTSIIVFGQTGVSQVYVTTGHAAGSVGGTTTLNVDMATESSTNVTALTGVTLDVPSSWTITANGLTAMVVGGVLSSEHYEAITLGIALASATTGTQYAGDVNYLPLSQSVTDNYRIMAVVNPDEQNSSSPFALGIARFTGTAGFSSANVIQLPDPILMDTPASGSVTPTISWTQGTAIASDGLFITEISDPNSYFVWEFIRQNNTKTFTVPTLPSSVASFGLQTGTTYDVHTSGFTLDVPVDFSTFDPNSIFQNLTSLSQASKVQFTP
ncbi:MAG: IPT/TIG domain-containing protein [Planctomycetes bacterium]|nr:IPT/TIG domain-containing protein [Planctomycetota bacterium]